MIVELVSIRWGRGSGRGPSVSVTKRRVPIEGWSGVSAARAVAIATRRHGRPTVQAARERREARAMSHLRRRALRRRAS